MGDLVRTASDGSLSGFALALAGVLITALIAVVVWLVRERIEARKRYDETLEKRLQAGSAKMETLERDLRAVQTRALEASARLVNQDQCAECKREIRSGIDRVAETSRELTTSTLHLGGRVDEGFRQVSRLLSRIVRIPRGPGEEGEEGTP